MHCCIKWKLFIKHELDQGYINSLILCSLIFKRMWWLGWNKNRKHLKFIKGIQRISVSHNKLSSLIGRSIICYICRKIGD